MIEWLFSQYDLKWYSYNVPSTYREDTLGRFVIWQSPNNKFGLVDYSPSGMLRYYETLAEAKQTAEKIFSETETVS